MRTIKIKNNDVITRIWEGQEIQPGQYYIVPELELQRFATSSALITSIALGHAIINDGLTDLSTVNDQVVYLKGELPFDVVTRAEKDDKILKTVQGNGITDSNGRCSIAFPVPKEGRWLAYGDAEFKNRHFFDRIEKIYLKDTSRQIAWAIALAQDPQAVAPVSDQDVIDLGADAPGGPYPEYPSVGEYHDTDMTVGDEIYTGGPPSYCPGMAMTYQYGTTEATPVGGYAYIPGILVPTLPENLQGLVEFVVVLYKGEDLLVGRSGQHCKVSLDWAKAK